MAYTIDQLFPVAKRFRETMNQSDFSDTLWLRQFPKEACDITCKLLWMYYYEFEFRGFEIMSGSPLNCASWKHQWLRFDNVVVDITADQFENENLLDVIVSGRPQWHDALSSHVFKNFNDEYYREMKEGLDCGFVRKMYDRILAHIPK